MKVKKRWSQVFINSSWVSKMLTRALSDRPFLFKTVCEIGPGFGALTFYMLKCTTSKLILIEIDMRFLTVYLNLMKAWPGKIDLIIRDAIKINYRALVLGSKLNLLASSLPFHIASRLLILLSCLSCLMLVIFQKEVFLRMKSSYSSLSLIFMKYNIMKLFDIPSFRFLPKPNVFCVCVLMTPIASVCSNTICNLINTMRRFNRICNAK